MPGAGFVGVVDLNHEERFLPVIDVVPAAVVVVDARTHVILDVNDVAVGFFGAPRDRIVGATCHRYICPKAQGQCPVTDLGQSVDNAERIALTADARAVSVLKTVRRTVVQGRDCLIESFFDLTERKRVEEDLARQAADLRAQRDLLEEGIRARTAEIEQKSREILELSTPVLQVAPGFLVVPLIGTLDSGRAERLATVLLDAVAERGANRVALDVTGVPIIDSSTARFLLETVQAVKLLGARVVLTGIRPHVASTLIHLGINLKGVEIGASLDAVLHKEGLV